MRWALAGGGWRHCLVQLRVLWIVHGDWGRSVAVLVCAALVAVVCLAGLLREEPEHSCPFAATDSCPLFSDVGSRSVHVYWQSPSNARFVRRYELFVGETFRAGVEHDEVRLWTALLRSLLFLLFPDILGGGPHARWADVMTLSSAVQLYSGLQRSVLVKELTPATSYNFTILLVGHRDSIRSACWRAMTTLGESNLLANPSFEQLGRPLLSHMDFGNVRFAAHWEPLAMPYSVAPSKSADLAWFASNNEESNQRAAHQWVRVNEIFVTAIAYFTH